MRELVSMWSNTRMVVLMALTAALYAASMAFFKGFQIIPGFTEIRPGAAVPVVCGILFGPAACWGSAVGNLIGDVFGGQFGPGSAFGFVANFLYAFVPYKASEAFRLDRARDEARRLLGFVVVCLGAASACALVVGWGVDLLNAYPYAFLSIIVFVNNALASLILGPVLLAILLPRVQRWNLSYRDVMDIPSERRASMTSTLLLLGAAIGGFIILNLISLKFLNAPLLSPSGVKGTETIRIAGLPFLAAMGLSILLL